MDDGSYVAQGDARELETRLPDLLTMVGLEGPDRERLTATITSPPYGNLLDYGVENQIGFGQTRAQYLADCSTLFESVYRATRPDGVLWLVVDSYLDGSPHDNGVTGLNVLPFTLASLAEQVGWTLREVIIWHKDKTRPWTHRGKLRNAFEYVLLLVKSPAFKFRPDRLRDNSDLAQWWVRYPERYNVFGKIPDNVWHVPIPVQGSWASKSYQHACPLPPELVRRMILLTTDEDDVVLDPFAGIGTVPGVAGALKRRGIGLELNGKFVQSFDDHVRDEIFDRVALSNTLDGPTPEVIANLRLLKFPRALFAKYREVAGAALDTRAIICEADDHAAIDAKGTDVGRATWTFVVDDSTRSARAQMEVRLREIASRAPFTKYGVSGTVRVLSPTSARRTLAGRGWFAYEHGRTWCASQEVMGASALRLPISHLRGHFPPLIANINLRVEINHVGDTVASEPPRGPRN